MKHKEWEDKSYVGGADIPIFKKRRKGNKDTTEET